MLLPYFIIISLKPNSYEKNILFIVCALFVCALVCIGLSSCSHSSDRITSSKITKLYNNYLKENALSQEFANVTVGYYETTAEERCALKRLEAAGLVTVSFERFAWWEKVEAIKKVPKTTYDWWGYAHTQYVSKKINEYSFEDHIMATVALTPAGNNLIIKDLPENKEKEDKDLVQPKFDTSKYPECLVDCTENWPEIKNPFITENNVEQEAPKGAKTQAKDNKKEETKNEEARILRKDSAQYVAYMKALKQVSKTQCILKGCTVKATKARNIQIVNENGIKTAVAEVIIEKKNVSDAYRVTNGVISGEKETHTVLLTYYLDKGWVLIEDPLTEFTEKFKTKWEDICTSVIKAITDDETDLDDDLVETR